MKVVTGKLLYALLFLGILPFSLWLWANQTRSIVRFPSIESATVGSMVCIAGGILLAWGMLALIKYGEGLPMNAYPPKKHVNKGPYRLMKHPIYCGFGILLIGIFILTGSASGLWLVTPVTILGMIALVWGYERIDLKRRFPNEKAKSYLDIPGRESVPADFRDRFSSLFWIFFLLITQNFVVWYLQGETLPAFGKTWNFNLSISGPVTSLLSLLFIAGVPILLKKRNSIRAWTLSMMAAFSCSIYISLLWPAIGAQFFSAEAASVNSQGIPAAVLVSVPFFLILISLRAYIHSFRRLTILFSIVALALGFCVLANSKSPILHLAEAAFIYAIAAYYAVIWRLLRDLSERVANSWKEWVFGPIRIINHGFYVGFSAFFGILLAGWLAGKDYAWAILIFALVVVIFSALWAQLIEGSEKLKRPFGYYGALVGIILAALIVWAMGYNVWVIIGLASVFMPWMQALGRFRCLVNGCCHGCPTPNPTIGIRYFHHRSRVGSISGLKGELVHPTPLYAVIWLFFVGFVLLSLWNSNYPSSFIFGLYLILTGMGRFVEEAYRGEVQTPVWKGLRLYQWTAVASVLIGVVMTGIPVKAILSDPVAGWQTFAAALIGGLFTFFAMGVDFPNSNARFSRLV